jgi:hypothetical protein
MARAAVAFVVDEPLHAGRPTASVSVAIAANGRDTKR